MSLFKLIKIIKQAKKHNKEQYILIFPKTFSYMVSNSLSNRSIIIDLENTDLRKSKSLE